jgi:thiamine-monophosphate kinase
MSVENVHFNFKILTVEDVGYRVVTAALSDIAAMAATPLSITVSIALSNQDSTEELELWIRKLYQGVRAATAPYNISVAGGDITRSPRDSQWHPIAIDVTALGYILPAQKARTRSGAQAHQIIAVSGPLGGSALGLDMLSRESASLKHVDEMKYDEATIERFKQSFRRPQARFDLVDRLQSDDDCTALIDISDGLSSELQHLCLASRVGADINWTELQTLVSPLQIGNLQPALSLGALKVLGGGEDYELLGVFKSYCPEGFKPIGHTTSHVDQIRLIEKDYGLANGIAKEIKMPKLGYDHFS